jgi:hypothetical protein
MENTEIKTRKPKTKTKLGKSGEVIEQEQFRVVMNKEANAGLEDFLAKVNEGFEGGTASRSDVTNYVFTRLKTLLSESDIRAIQGACFDDKEALVSLGKSEKDLPESVRKAIREAYGLLEKDKKRSVKLSQELSTEHVVDNSDAA